MAAMHFEQVQRFILAKKFFGGDRGTFKRVALIFFKFERPSYVTIIQNVKVKISNFKTRFFPDSNILLKALSSGFD